MSIFSALILSALLIYFIVGPYDKTRIIFKNNYLLGVLIIGAFISGVIMSWVKFLDRSVKLVINQKGIWTKKDGLLPWSNIHYFYFAKNEDEGGGDSLRLKFFHPEKEIAIDISHFKLGRTGIDKAIAINSAGYPVIRLLE